jgi:hypothetical protein
MPSRWAFESLVIPEAQARPLIDGGTSPPTVIQTNAPPVSDANTRRDMADAFFKQKDRWRNSNVLAFLVLLFQMTACLVFVGCLLLLRDTV